MPSSGYLSSMMSGGANSPDFREHDRGAESPQFGHHTGGHAPRKVGRVPEGRAATNTNSLNIALENVTASQSAIRDADFASETAAMTRAQVLVQANTSILATANATPQSVLSLLH